jgi:ParB/RepB/Spo0J family partition protein
MNAVAVSAPTVAIDLIDVGENVRPLDPEHVEHLASSIALRGVISPVTLVANGERFTLVAGHHRIAACRSLEIAEVPFSLRESEGTSADGAAENILRKGLSPLEEARAVKRMFDEGFSADGTAATLGWSRRRVTERAKILTLPQAAQELLGSGAIPVGTVDTLVKIQEVSPELCAAVVAPIAEGAIQGSLLVGNLGWVIGYAKREGHTKAFVAYLETLPEREVSELRLGKKADAALEEAEALHTKLIPNAYGPPTIRFGEQDVDQARAAQVLIEIDHTPPIITDRTLYRELAKQAILRTVEQLREAKAQADAEAQRSSRNGKGKPSQQQQLNAKHRARMRTLKAQAHGTNLDLGAALLKNLAAVDPRELDVARFFVYGVLGIERGYGRDTLVDVIAASGIRLVIDEHRETITPRLKGGGWGKTKVSYADPEAAIAWLWKFIGGAKDARELYGRALVVFAAQHYAEQLILPQSKRRSSAIPSSHKDIALKAFERLTKSVLPTSHLDLRRALEREARAHGKAVAQLGKAAKAAAQDSSEAGEAA